MLVTRGVKRPVLMLKRTFGIFMLVTVVKILVARGVIRRVHRCVGSVLI